VREVERRAVDAHRARVSDVDDAQLAPLAEVRAAQWIGRHQSDRRLGGHASDDRAVLVGVHQADPVGREQVVHQIVRAQVGGGEAADLTRVGGVPDLHTSDLFPHWFLDGTINPLYRMSFHGMERLVK
jgi:hypothetical protein